LERSVPSISTEAIERQNEVQGLVSDWVTRLRGRSIRKREWSGKGGGEKGVWNKRDEWTPKGSFFNTLVQKRDVWECEGRWGNVNAEGRKYAETRRLRGLKDVRDASRIDGDLESYEEG
jgi:hypothetical protein